jgi:diguanylate cyclase (GGDEF)-like protein
MIGKKYESFMPEDQLSEDEAQKKIRAQGQDAVYERCFLNKNGQRHWTLVSAKSVLDSDGKFVSSFGMFTDINERKQLEAKLQQQASTDELTGLSNRRHFLDLASLELKRASRFKHPISLALFDIDHFKLINDRHGHAAGDHALRFLAKICQENIRELDIFARFGGDEFALLLPETNALLAYKVLERIRLNVNAQPILLDNIPVYFCISMGLACLEEKNVPLDILLARADQALYQAKEGGRNRVFLEIQPGSEDL